jgi:hypothetical protein
MVGHMNETQAHAIGTIPGFARVSIRKAAYYLAAKWLRRRLRASESEKQTAPACEAAKGANDAKTMRYL